MRPLIPSAHEHLNQSACELRETFLKVCAASRDAAAAMNRFSDAWHDAMFFWTMPPVVRALMIRATERQH